LAVKDLPKEKTVEGRIVEGICAKEALRDRRDALSELVEPVRRYRKLADSGPLTLQGSDYAKAVERLNVAIDRVFCRHACFSWRRDSPTLMDPRTDEREPL
jgi:hypothetical protein